MSKIARFILKMFGWEVFGEFPRDLKKAIVVGAPHTSNVDFLIAVLTYRALGFKARYLMKKEMFFFPLGCLLKAMGAIPVDRRPGNTVVDDVVKAIDKSDKFLLTVAPEGTRSKVEEWKGGFWRIAKATGLPVYAGTVNYKEKKAGVLGEVELSDDFEADVKKTKAMYKAEWAKYPEMF